MEVYKINIQPMKVLSYNYIGKDHEQNAINTLIKFAIKENLLIDKDEYMFYGINDPGLSPQKPEYGYEFWLPINIDLNPADKSFKVIEFDGGIFAVTDTPLKDFILNNTWNIFHPEIPWLKENKFQYDCNRQWLESFTIKKGDLNAFASMGGDLSRIKVSLYMPVKKA